MIERLALLSWENPDTQFHVGIVLLLSYLTGSVPFGLIFGWIAGAGDIRKIGSGNIGATNVLRTGKRWAAAATLFCDAAKGFIAVTVADDYYAFPVFPALAGLGAFIGHLFPVWLGFRGGKGVATFIGVTAALSWPVAALTCASWLMAARAMRISSLAALIAAVMTPLYFLLISGTLYAALALVLAIFIVIAHRANIVRLLKNEEPRIGAS